MTVKYRTDGSTEWHDLGGVYEVCFFGASGCYMEVRRYGGSGGYPDGSADFKVVSKDGLRGECRGEFISRSASHKGEFLTYGMETLPKWEKSQ